MLGNTATFQTRLLNWFQKNGRHHLPWRNTRDPWAILVSEIMLQQTTVASVIAHRRFEKFLHTFPDLQSIAHAPEAELLKAWEGLGYYNRVRNLQKTAQAILTKHHGQFPQNTTQLLNLPGIGAYTAGALASFAFDQAAPIVDGNITRVLTRLYDYHQEIQTTPARKQLWKWAAELLPTPRSKKSPRTFNSALMELGQTHCAPRSPDCTNCPVHSHCAAYQNQTPLETLPKKKARRKFIHLDEHALLVLKNDTILLSQEAGTRRQGFWLLPLRSADELAHLPLIHTSRYTITHHKVTLHLYQAPAHHLPLTLAPQEAYHPLDQLPNLPLATPIRKAIYAVLSKRASIS